MSRSARSAAEPRPARARAKAAQPVEQRMLLTAALILLAFGAVMVYSASSARNLLQGNGDGTQFLVRYVAFGSVGLVVMHVMSRRGVALLRQLTPLMLIG